MAKFIFSQQDANGATDLFSTDGTAAGTTDLDMSRFGFPPNSAGFDFVPFDGRTLFLGLSTIGADFPGGESAGVYATDGTAGGTSYAPIGGDGGPAGPNGLWVVGNTVLTSGPTEIGPPGIWASINGTDFTQIESGVGISGLVVSNSIGLFDGVDESGKGLGLWRTDGTAAGTYSVTPANTTLNPQGFTPVGGGKTVFVDAGPDGTGALWVTDGTSIGTSMLNPLGLGTQVAPGGAETSGKAILTATDEAGQQSIWASDGTSAGTVEIAVSGSPGAPVRHSGAFTAWNGKVLFSTGYALAVTDGTKSGTVILPTGVPASFATVGSRIFVNSDDGSGPLLSVSDGTIAGTAALRIPNLASITGPLTPVGTNIVFEGTDSTGSVAFFSTDGTVAGSHELTLPAGITLSASSPSAIAPLPDSGPAGGSGTVTLGGGSQTYTAAAGTTVLAGDGNDTVTAANGKVTVIGSSGTLTFVGGTGSSSVAGRQGSDTILGGAGGGSFAGGSAGHDLLISQGASGANTTLTGAAAGDELFGSAAGNDLLVAGGGRETILGGGGPTTIQGGAAADVIFTASGPTTLFGGTGGADTVVGGAGKLTLVARNGDAMFGGSGSLAITASTTGADSIVGGSGTLAVNGQGGNMLVVGSTTASDILTGSGAALVFAGAGSTSVTGGTGPLQVVLGTGKATVSEGSGPAVFDVMKGSAGGADVLNGFRPGTDKVELFGYAASQLQLSVSNGSTLLTLSDGTRIQVVGVTNMGNSITG